MNNWRAQDEEIQDDLRFCAVEKPDVPKLSDWLDYQRYCDQARERFEIVLDFEHWVLSRQNETKAQ